MQTALGCSVANTARPILKCINTVTLTPVESEGEPIQFHHKMLAMHFGNFF